MRRKTKKMIAVEEQFQQTLEKMLPEMVTEYGLTATADELGVSKATLGYWLLKLGINVQRVAYSPALLGESKTKEVNSAEFTSFVSDCGLLSSCGYNSPISPW